MAVCAVQHALDTRSQPRQARGIKWTNAKEKVRAYCPNICTAMVILTLYKLAICDFVCGMNFGIKAPPTLFCFWYKSWSILCCLNFFCITIRDKNTSCQNLSVLTKVSLHGVESYWDNEFIFQKKPDLWWAPLLRLFTTYKSDQKCQSIYFFSKK